MLHKQTEEKEKKSGNNFHRNEIQVELSQYVRNLKSKNNPIEQNKQCAGKDLESGDGGSSNLSNGVIFPSNFDDVVDCISREDLIDRKRKDNSEKENAKGLTNHEFDWAHHIFFAGVSELGIFREYESELTEKLTRQEDLQNELSKILLNDRKIARIEKEQNENDIKFESEITKLKGELKTTSLANTEMTVSTSSDDSISSPAAERSIHNGADKSRFFMTDTFRSMTPTSSCNDIDIGSASCRTLELNPTAKLCGEGMIIHKDHGYEKNVCEGNKSFVKPVDIIQRNKTIIRKSSLLTIQEEDRVSKLLDLHDKIEEDSIKSIAYFGSKDLRENLGKINYELRSMGFLYNSNLDEDNFDPPPRKNSRKSCVSDPLREIATKRANEKKLKEIDTALRVLSNLQQKIQEKGDTLSSHLCDSNDIQKVIQETKLEFEEDSIQVICKEDIQILIQGLA